jgi:hypothetical protein
MCGFLMQIKELSAGNLFYCLGGLSLRQAEELLSTWKLRGLQGG